MNLRALGEEELLRKLLPHLPLNRSVISGAGDDCAVVQFDGSRRILLVLKTDCIVEGIHFRATSKAVEIGWKAMARPLSDFAAMSAVPQFALVTFIAPAKTKLRWIEEVYRGLGKAARAFDVAIVGGETSRTDGPTAISVSVTGTVEKKRWVSRSGGKIADELFVTGKLGGSIRGRHLRFLPRIAESRWLTKHFPVHAMMDLSDGLGADLPRLARASNLGFELNTDSIPRTRGCTAEQAISDGEDYELLFAISPRKSSALQSAWQRKFPKIPLTRIGQLCRSSTSNSQRLPGGYDHFA